MHTLDTFKGWIPPIYQAQDTLVEFSLCRVPIMLLLSYSASRTIIRSIYQTTVSQSSVPVTTQMSRMPEPHSLGWHSHVTFHSRAGRVWLPSHSLTSWSPVHCMQQIMCKTYAVAQPWRQTWNPMQMKQTCPGHSARERNLTSKGSAKTWRFLSGDWGFTLLDETDSTTFEKEVCAAPDQKTKRLKAPPTLATPEITLSRWTHLPDKKVYGPFGKPILHSLEDESSLYFLSQDFQSKRKLWKGISLASFSLLS